VFDKWDAILAPIAPVPAFPHDTRPFQRRSLKTSDGREIPYNSMLTWISLATALHLPATAAPAGRTPEGLPVGAQIIGPLGGDARTLAIAQAIDENVRGFEPPPL
jgi:amidase